MSPPSQSPQRAPETCGGSGSGWTDGQRSPQSPHPDPCLPAAVPMTVRWVLAVMLVTTLVAMHSHSPWSSLLRARNWRLPLGRALCLLLLGFPTLAKQGGKEEGREEESGRAGGGEKPPTPQGRRSRRIVLPPSTHPARAPSGSPLAPQHMAPQNRHPPSSTSPGSPGTQRYLSPGDDREGVPRSSTGDQELPAGFLPVLPAW